MLRKLLKYDLRALSRVMLPLQGGAILAALLGILSYKYIINKLLMNTYGSSYYASSAVVDEIGAALSLLLTVLSSSALFATSLVTFLLIGRHYYQSLLGDEGYLSFTLPVSADKHLISKIIAGAVWLTINATIIVLAVSILTFVGLASTGFFGFAVDGYFGELIGEVSFLLSITLAIELFITVLFSAFSLILLIYVALTIGAVIAKTHKVLAGIGMFAAIGMVSSIITSIITTTVGIVAHSSGPSFNPYSELLWFYDAQWTLLPGLFLSIVFCVVYYLINRHLLNTKLNLE